MNADILATATAIMVLALDYASSQAAIQYTASQLPSHLGPYWRGQYAREAFTQLTENHY